MRSALLVAFLAGCAVEDAQPAEPLSNVEQATTVCGVGPTVKGIDVSYHDGSIDWNAVKNDGVVYAFIRVSDGTGFHDPQFANFWAAAKAAGVIRGAYQYFEPGQDVIGQADLLLSDIGGKLDPGDLPPVIDVEATGGLSASGVASAVQTWVQHVQAAIGRAPIIYTGLYFWQDSVGNADMSSSPLWHAQYTSASCPNIASPPWSNWAFWQYTESGSVAGISGAVDIDRWNGDLASLQTFIGSGGTTTDPCPALDASGGIVDDSTPCFTAGGPTTGMRHVTGVGQDNDLYWTHTTNQATEQNFGQWELNLSTAGKYKIEVSTPAAYAQSKQATYVVHAGGGDKSVPIDQTAVDGWQTLGEFDLAQGSDQWVHVGDNTGEPGTGMVQLVFDAVRVTPVGGGTGSGSGSGAGDGMGMGMDGTSMKSAGCSTGGGAGLWLALALVGMRRRRR